MKNVKYRVLFPKGWNKKEVELSEESISESYLDNIQRLGKLRDYLRAKFIKGRKGSESSSSQLAKKLRLCEFEEASDNGHLRWLPRGVVIFKVIKRWCEEIALDRLNANEIDSPIMYDWAFEEIKEQGLSFHERHYKINLPEDEKKLVLRFAGDFGLFRIMKQAQISYRNLPIRMFEFSKSFRYEKHGEISGLRRPRAFHMPDIHSFCRDFDQGWNEFVQLFKAYEELNQEFGLELAVEFPVEMSFYKKNKNKIQELVNWLGRPVLIELLAERNHYWVIKGDFHYVDPSGSEGQTSTVQLDVEDAQRYGIVYKDSDGDRRPCMIVHSSMGSVERIAYALLEKSAKDNKFPFWLAPEQLRVLPISDKFNDNAQELADKFASEGFRCGIDDRSERLSYKIRELGRDWVPYGIVVGDKEVDSQKFDLKVRGGEDIEDLEVSEILSVLHEQQGSMPQVRSLLNVKVSKRPIF